MSITIITNNVPRELISVDQVPVAEQHWFDYVEGEDRFSPRIFQYLGSFYDVNEFSYVPTHFAAGVPDSLQRWDGIQTDSFFSGVLVRWPIEFGCTTPDYERVVVGRYYS